MAEKMDLSKVTEILVVKEGGEVIALITQNKIIEKDGYKVIINQN